LSVANTVMSDAYWRYAESQQHAPSTIPGKRPRTDYGIQFLLPFLPFIFFFFSNLGFLLPIFIIFHSLGFLIEIYIIFPFSISGFPNRAFKPLSFPNRDFHCSDFLCMRTESIPTFLNNLQSFTFYIRIGNLTLFLVIGICIPDVGCFVYMFKNS